MRKTTEMPQAGNRVTILENGRNYGKTGTVVSFTPGSKSARAYTVKIGSQLRKFRAGDVWKPSQIDWK